MSQFQRFIGNVKDGIVKERKRPPLICLGRDGAEKLIGKEKDRSTVAGTL